MISINKELPGSSPSCRLLRCGYCFSKYCRTTGHCRRFRYEAIRNNGPVSVSVPNCIPVAHGVTFRLWSSLIALHAGLNHSFIAALAPPHRFVAPWNSAACLAIQSLSHTSLQFPNQASQANACHRDKPEWLSGLRVCESASLLSGPYLSGPVIPRSPALPTLVWAVMTAAVVSWRG